jgi:hypothetical protein
MSLAAAGGVLWCTPAHGAVVPVFNVSQELLEQRVTPAPLVPTYVPPRLGGGFIEPGFAQGKVYSMRMLHAGPGGTDGVIALQRCAPIGRAAFGTCTGLAATRREYVRQGYRSRASRVRGRRGFLLSRKGTGGPNRWLIWREDGLVYSIGSGTPRKVSIADLRATATRLDRLQHRYLGSSPDPDNHSGAVLVAGEHFVAGHIDWHGACNSPDGHGRSGAADLAVVPRLGNAFSLDVGGAASTSASGWAGTISGTVSPTAIVLSIRATGVFDGVSCDTGALSLTLDVFDRSSFASQVTRITRRTSVLLERPSMPARTTTMSPART